MPHPLAIHISVLQPLHSDQVRLNNPTPQGHPSYVVANYQLIFITHVRSKVFEHLICLVAVAPSPHQRVAVAKSLNLDLIRVGEWCDLWEYVSNMYYAIVLQVHPQSPSLILSGILDVTFDKMTFD